jgi:hypothetical protein
VATLWAGLRIQQLVRETKKRERAGIKAQLMGS